MTNHYTPRYTSSRTGCLHLRRFVTSFFSSTLLCALRRKTIIIINVHNCLFVLFFCIFCTPPPPSDNNYFIYQQNISRTYLQLIFTCLLFSLVHRLQLFYQDVVTLPVKVIYICIKVMIVRLQYNIENTQESLLPVCGQAYNWKNIFIEKWRRLKFCGPVHFYESGSILYLKIEFRSIRKGASIEWRFHFHWWTASIKPRLLFSLWNLCFFRTFPFVSLFECLP